MVAKECSACEGLQSVSPGCPHTQMFKGFALKFVIKKNIV